MTFAFSTLRLRTVVIITIAALLAWSVGLPSWIHSANAANVSTFSDTLSDSDLGVDATHTIQFTTESNWVATAGGGLGFQFTFDAGNGEDAFDPSSITAADITAVSSGGSTITFRASSGACSATPSEVYFDSSNNDSDYVRFGVCASDTIATSTTMTFTIGNSGSNEVTNPATSDSYVIRLEGFDFGNGEIPDSGDTRVFIIDDVTVTAVVETTFQFRINGINATSSAINDEVPAGEFGTTTATSVPFGVVTPGTSEFLAQRLEVDTNAANGFTVTVFADQTLTAGNGADIDTFDDGTNRASSSVWAGPSNTFGNEDTYGHWGLTSDDDDVGSTTLVYGDGTPLYVGNFVNNPVPVFYHDQPVDEGVSPTQGESFTHVGYKIEVDSLQEAANDYTATLTYIATPVF